MSLIPPFLNKGDKIAVVAPARKTSPDELRPFILYAERAGFEVVYTEQLFAIDNQFAGDDRHRAIDFQYWLDSNEVKAIISAKGGYGTARIIDLLDFTSFIQNPKWIIGFSDLTVIHNHLNCIHKICTLHAGMAAYMDDSKPEVAISFRSMFEVLKGNIPLYNLKDHPMNKAGDCEGILLGGNLSVIYSTMGSVSELDTKDAILFFEDLDEYLYHMDRMMVCLKRAGKLKKIKGLIVGHMNSMRDNAIPFGKTVEEIIKEHTEIYGFPIYFGFDAGHLNPNLPLIFGMKVKIENNCLNFGDSQL